MSEHSEGEGQVSRRSVLTGAAAGLGWAALAEGEAAAHAEKGGAAVAPKAAMKLTKLKTSLVKRRWLFLRGHAEAGLVGRGEPILEGRAKTCAAAVKEIEPYLVGKDPRQVVHHWQAI